MRARMEQGLGGAYREGDAVAGKGDVALPVAPDVGQRAGGGEAGGVEGRLPQDLHALLGHHVLTAQHLQAQGGVRSEVQSAEAALPWLEEPRAGSSGGGGGRRALP